MTDNAMHAIQGALAGMLAAADTDGPKDRVAAEGLATLVGVGLSALCRIADALEAGELRAVQAQMELGASRGDAQQEPWPFPGCTWARCAHLADCASASKCISPMDVGWTSSSSSTVPGGA